MTAPDKTTLLFGPYTPPALRKGDKATCLYRDCDVVITSWSAGRIPWPRCIAIGSRGGSGLLVDEELARAVRGESSAAIQHHWGVTEGVVWRWRKALGVGPLEPEGSRRLHQAKSRVGAAVNKARGVTAAERRERSRNARRLNLGRHLSPGYHGPRWTEEQLTQVGAQPDEVVAAKVGRSVNAVQVLRSRLGLANPAPDYNGKGPPWAAEEDELLRTLKPKDAAERTGRTLGAVYARRHVMNIGR